MSSSNCCFLTCIEVSQEAGQVVWYSHLFQNFPQFIVIHIVKGFGPLHSIFTKQNAIQWQDRIIYKYTTVYKFKYLLQIWCCIYHLLQLYVPTPTVVLEKTLESPLGHEEIKPVNPKGNQSWIFIGRTDAEAETTVLWPPDANSQLIGKDPDAGKYWRQEGKGITEDEMVRWHHWLNGHEFEQALGVGDGQGSLMCCSPWGHK